MCVSGAVALDATDFGIQYHLGKQCRVCQSYSRMMIPKRFLGWGLGMRLEWVDGPLGDNIKFHILTLPPCQQTQQLHYLSKHFKCERKESTNCHQAGTYSTALSSVPPSPSPCSPTSPRLTSTPLLRTTILRHSPEVAIVLTRRVIPAVTLRLCVAAEGAAFEDLYGGRECVVSFCWLFVLGLGDEMRDERDMWGLG